MVSIWTPVCRDSAPMESDPSRLSVIGCIAKSACSCSRYRMHDGKQSARICGGTETTDRPAGKDRCGSGARAEACCSRRHFGGDCGLLVLHRAAFAVRPWRQRRVDRQFDQATYQPIFVAMTLACLGYGYWLVWRARRTACDEDAPCSRPLPNRVVSIALVAATLLVAAAVAFDFLAPLILT